MKQSFKKILILGSGGLKIGQAGEFDYSGSQAIKAFKEKGIETILINPNIATIQTDKGLADKVYFLPVKLEFVKRVIKKERPDAIALSFGGQTALNCGIKLYDQGILKKYEVKVLGTPISTIKKTEDRDLFVKELNKIKVKTPKSVAVKNKNEAYKALKKIGYPIIVRAAYTLGGQGSGFVKNDQELEDTLNKAFSYSKQVLIEESLKGWKEVEYEVVRDAYNNCVTVCNMENFDPLGIHTGESIVVAPSQTLDNREYHFLRSLAMKTIKHLKIIGECNIQYALDPKTLDYRVIEVNARLSRSSALASKATGYPLAYIAAKLALNQKLYEIKNTITKVTTACYEPALDYLVLKFPRWDLNKFRKVSEEIGSEMKSVGEIMAIGRNFQEIIQKAIRMLQTGSYGFTDWSFEFPDIKKELKEPTPRRIFAIAAALESGMSVKEIAELSQIDPWFLFKLKEITDHRIKIKKLKNFIKLKSVPKPKNYPKSRIKTKNKKNTIYKIAKVLDKKKVESIITKAKKLGFSDAQIGWHMDVNEKEIRSLRKKLKILPTVKQIDTLAAEFPAKTNYLYLTYNGKENDIEYINKGKKVIVLGSGPYCIGSSVEFDWCCVNTIKKFKKLKYQTVMVNYNPETVSTDYDECDRLYFEELSEERALDIWDIEKANGVVVSVGGQIPNNLALPLYRQKVKIFGTNPENIDRAEDRHKFSSMLDLLDINQPKWQELTNIQSAVKFAKKVGYPVLVRPSYVLSGMAMAVAYNEKHLKNYLNLATQISSEHPVVISKFQLGSKEIEVDAVAKNGKIVIYAIGEHVEHAGVHSGDATIALPAQRVYLETIRKIKKITKAIAKELNITGPFNIQFLAKSDIKVIECNLRASRSFPFASKITGHNFIKIATEAMVKNLKERQFNTIDLDYVGVKAPQFSFSRLKNADPILGVEMTSTGEVATIGDSLEEALLKSLLAVNFRIPQKNIFVYVGEEEAKVNYLKYIIKLQELGYQIFTSVKFHKFLINRNIKKIKKLEFLKNKQCYYKEHIQEIINKNKIELVINIPSGVEKPKSKGYAIRRSAVDSNIPLINNLQNAKLLVLALEKNPELKIKSWDQYVDIKNY